MVANAIVALSASNRSMSDVTPCSIIAKFTPNRFGMCDKRIAKVGVWEE